VNVSTEPFNHHLVISIDKKEHCGPETDNKGFVEFISVNQLFSDVIR
jgi:hypothetical protein